MPSGTTSHCSGFIAVTSEKHQDLIVGRSMLRRLGDQCTRRPQIAVVSCPWEAATRSVATGSIAGLNSQAPRNPQRRHWQHVWLGIKGNLLRPKASSSQAAGLAWDHRQLASCNGEPAHLADALAQRCAGQGSALPLGAPLAALCLACRPGPASQTHVAAVAIVTVTVTVSATTMATMAF